MVESLLEFVKFTLKTIHAKVAENFVCQSIRLLSGGAELISFYCQYSVITNFAALSLLHAVLNLLLIVLLLFL